MSAYCKSLHSLLAVVDIIPVVYIQGPCDCLRKTSSVLVIRVPCTKENAGLPCVHVRGESALLLKLLMLIDTVVTGCLLFQDLLLTTELSSVLVEIDGSSARDFFNFKDPFAS